MDSKILTIVCFFLLFNSSLSLAQPVNKPAVNRTTIQQAIVETTALHEYHGVSVFMDLWGTQVEKPDIEYSASLIRLQAGSTKDDNFTSIEAGWHVYPALYKGNHDPRFFVHWTHKDIDGQNRTAGCYNLNCTGFVVYNESTLKPGRAFAPVSSYTNAGIHHGNSIKVLKSNTMWQLFVNGIPVGYWPASIFTNGTADKVVLGGEVLEYSTSENHTKTQMGSGLFANQGYGKAACIQDIKIYKSLLPSVVIAGREELNWTAYADDDKCYSVTGVKNDATKSEGGYFYFGGPGGTYEGCK